MAATDSGGTSCTLRFGWRLVAMLIRTSCIVRSRQRGTDRVATSRQSGRRKPELCSAGMALLVLAVLIGVAGLRWERVDAASVVGMRWTIEMLALVTWWIGSFVLCFGTRMARDCAFPLLFLLWLVPMPEVGSALCHRVLAARHGLANPRDVRRGRHSGYWKRDGSDGSWTFRRGC